MNNYKNNNNVENSEIQSNLINSNINLIYNKLSTNNNMNNHSSSSNDININDNERENTDNTSNNIESEIEMDLKKYAKSFNVKNINKNMYLNKNKFEEQKKVDLIENNLIKLKNCGYPEMGKIYLSPDLHEQEKTFAFFEYIVKKESLNLNNKEKYKKKYEELEYQLRNLKQELNNEIKSNALLQEDLEYKIKIQKEYYDKQFANLNKDNLYLKSVISKMTNEKNDLELKLHNLNETINKFESMKSIIINAFEAIDYVQTNDMSKMLSRVKGAEKLIEALKGGYNDSLKELMKEINILKNFIIDVNNEFCLILDNPCNIDENIYNISFFDSITLIKNAFKNNMNQLRAKIGYCSQSESNNESYGKENCFESLNQFINSRNPDNLNKFRKNKK
jgi:hypothetical protein